MRHSHTASMAGFYALTLVAALIASTYCGAAPLVGWLLGVIYLTRPTQSRTTTGRPPTPCQGCKHRRRKRTRQSRHPKRR
jgi:hypothetical protein